MKYEADIQFGVIVDKKTIGTRDLKEEDRYKIIGIMGLKFDGMKLVPCSLKDYVFKIKERGAEIKIGTYLCTGLNFVRYYGLWCNRKNCLDIFRSVLPVYNSKGEYLFTCGLDEVELPFIGNLKIRIDTSTLAHNIVFNGYKSHRIALENNESFFYVSTPIVLGYDDMQFFFSKVSDCMFVHGSTCFLRGCNNTIILPYNCEYCVSSLEEWNTTEIVLNKQLKYISLGSRAILGLKTVYMSRDSNKSLLSYLLYNFVRAYYPNNADEKDLHDTLKAYLKVYVIDEGRHDEAIELCYNEKYKALMESILNDVKFEIY